MKKLILIAFAALTNFIAQAQTLVTETRNVADFTKIEVCHGIEVIIANGENQLVKVQAEDEALINNIATESNGNTLKIYIKNNNFNRQLNKESLKVFITSSNITGLKAQAGAIIKTAGEFNTPAIAMSLSSGASFKGYIKSEEAFKLDAVTGSAFDGIVLAKSFYGDIRGGSVVKIAGSAQYANINTTTGAACLAGNFKCDHATANALRTSNITINVNKAIKVTADNTASVIYYGSPETVKLGVDSYAVKRN